MILWSTIGFSRFLTRKVPLCRYVASHGSASLLVSSVESFGGGFMEVSLIARPTSRREGVIILSRQDRSVCVLGVSCAASERDQ